MWLQSKVSKSETNVWDSSVATEWALWLDRRVVATSLVKKSYIYI
jgi:hypothetical protein